MTRNILFFGIIILCSFMSMYYINVKAREITKDLENVGIKNNYFNSNKIEKGLKLDNLSKGDLIISPVTISGKVSGKWFFEGVILAQVIGEDGTVLGTGTLESQGDWMTEEYVSFKGKVDFSQSKSKLGYVVIKADDPSGFGEIKPYRLAVTFE